MTEENLQLKDQLVDAEYRHAYAQDFLDMTLARQIRALRKARGWNQKQLADVLGTQQSRISEIEDEDYGALSIATLKDLARAFDVYLNVRFTSFSELLTQVDHTSMADLVVPPYVEDPALMTQGTFAAQVFHAPASPKYDSPLSKSFVESTMLAGPDDGAVLPFSSPMAA